MNIQTAQLRTRPHKSLSASDRQLTAKRSSKQTQPTSTFRRGVQLIIDFVSSRSFLYLTFAWFIFQALWMALSTLHSIPPDEKYHAEFIQLFAQNGWLPFITHTQPSFYHLGEVAHTPFILYHYLLSLPYHLFAGSSHALYILRFINIGFGAISFYLINRLANQLGLSKLVKNMGLFMMTNTLMFVFMTASVSYDNLFIVLTLLSFSLLLSIMERFSALRLLALIVTAAAGLFTKSSFLPIAFAVAVILLYLYIRKLPATWQSFKQTFKDNKIANSLLLVLLVLLSALFIQRYIVNVVTYHTYAPKCSQVNTVDQCKDTLAFKRAEAFKNAPPPTINTNFFQYITTWEEVMRQRTYGILGYQSIDKSAFIEFWSQVLLVVGLVATIRKISKKDKGMLLLLGITALYIAALMHKNHVTYVHYGDVALSVQGRYLFASLPILYFATSHYALKLFKGFYLQAGFVIITLLIFATASLPTYWLQTTPSWYTSKTAGINTRIHNFMIYRLDYRKFQ